MKVKELMERIGMTETGRAIAYIKDGLEEINILSESHVTTTKLSINKGQRFYPIPQEALKLLDIRCKNHLNTDDEFRSIPRMVGEPKTEDSDGK
jgi:hypothetical protein